jgi:Ca-activated chloride channel homolog
MLATRLVRSRLLRCSLPAVLLLCSGVGPSSSAQTQPASQAQAPSQAQPASQTQSASGAQPASLPRSPGIPPRRDLTQPQPAPNLSVDADPILSPDVDVKAPELPAVQIGKPAGAGDKGIQKQAQGFVLRADVDEVLLNCTVVDGNGHLVTDLDHNSFRVFEDGVPQAISSFAHHDVPVSLGILVDNSGSMRDKRGAVKDAAIHLVKASNPADSAFVVNFADDAYIDQDFTSDIGQLEKGLSRIDARGGTALYDAVVASANEMSRHAKQQKQVLLIITDGGDNASRLSLLQAIHRVQALEGPVVYTVGLLYDDLSKEEAGRARRDLEALALETGGVAYFPRSLQEVDEIAGQVARDVRNQYTLGYHSTKAASLGGYRTVHVDAIRGKHSNMVVRTRKGYIPKSVQQPQTAQASPQSQTPPPQTAPPSQPAPQ